MINPFEAAVVFLLQGETVFLQARETWTEKSSTENWLDTAGKHMPH